MRIELRIDPTTNLLQHCRFSGIQDGKPASREGRRFTFTLKAGPADIYDLGVPKSAKYVDRMPTDELQQIQETLQAGRQRMDDYRAIFANMSEGHDYMWWTERPMIWYRKGNKFRGDYVAGWDGELVAIERPAEGEDIETWWRERVKHLRFFTQSVTRDSTTFTSNWKNVTDPHGTEHVRIVSVSRIDYDTPAEAMFPAEWSMRPEFVCRPPIGIGGSDHVSTIDRNPSDGPAGCILLRVRRTTTAGRMKDRNAAGLPDEWRFWLDPERDYIVMREEMILRDEQGTEKLLLTTLLKKQPNRRAVSGTLRKSAARTRATLKRAILSTRCIIFMSISTWTCPIRSSRRRNQEEFVDLPNGCRCG